jgi:hypothetical protein
MPSRPRSQAAKAEAAEAERQDVATAAEQPQQVETELEEQTATIRRAAARIAARVPDDQLADLPDLELLEEARRRGVTFTRSVTRTQIIDAAVAAAAE